MMIDFDLAGARLLFERTIKKPDIVVVNGVFRRFFFFGGATITFH
jgi:hypothetical protein